MSQTISKLTYQINLPNSLEIKEDFYSPAFSTNNKLFWQLVIKLEEDEFYGVYLKPVAGPDEIIWGERSKLSFKLLIKEFKSYQTTELYSDKFGTASSDDKIKEVCGCPKAFKKSSLRNGELIIGVIFEYIEYKEYKVNSIINYSKPIPKNLIDAWKGQLFDFQPADVEFIVQGEKIYACSSILSERSEYFANILSGQWAESAVIQNEEKINQNESSIEANQIENNDIENNLENSSMYNVKKGDDSIVKDLTMQLNSNVKNNEPRFQIRHHIEVTDCESIAFSTMLEYLYTDQVEWTNKCEESITTKLFCLADKYLLSDLRERAKIRIIDELDISNVSEIMFSLVPKYEDLKEPVLNFMAKNFEKVSCSQKFKDTISLVNYSNYNVVLSEIWAEYFKIQKSKEDA